MRVRARTLARARESERARRACSCGAATRPCWPWRPQHRRAAPAGDPGRLGSGPARAQQACDRAYRCLSGCAPASQALRLWRACGPGPAKARRTPGKGGRGVRGDSAERGAAAGRGLGPLRTARPGRAAVLSARGARKETVGRGTGRLGTGKGEGRALGGWAGSPGRLAQCSTGALSRRAGEDRASESDSESDETVGRPGPADPAAAEQVAPARPARAARVVARPALSRTDSHATRGPLILPVPVPGAAGASIRRPVTHRHRCQ